MVLHQGMMAAAAGIGLGIVAALGLAQLVSSVLIGVSPGDPPAFFIAGAGLLLIAALACYLPARHAARIDPMAALRYE